MSLKITVNGVNVEPQFFFRVLRTEAGGLLVDKMFPDSLKELTANELVKGVIRINEIIGEQHAVAVPVSLHIEDADSSQSITLGNLALKFTNTELAAFNLESLGQVMISKSAIPTKNAEGKPQAEHTGGSVSYYKVWIENPIIKGMPAYMAECLDIALALEMTVPEYTMFKAIWRTAAERTLGLAKEGNNAKYDAEKIDFFSDINLRRYTK